VIQENNAANYSDAERYGDVVFMTVDEFKPNKGSLMNPRIIEQIKQKLSDFTGDDFLILTGNPTIIGFAFAVALDKLKPTEGLQVLQWDRMSSSYRPFTFDYKP
tara:strand:+ start:12973 stop:13284 length:312 start_codon:yes stop_codon:yes gene_type:complete